jgi:hypothetical protein
VTSARSVSETGPAVNCNPVNTASNSAGPVTSNGVTVTRVASGTTTLADAGDASDTGSVTTTAATKARATEAGGQLSSLAIDSTFSGSFSYAQGAGTDCDTAGQLASVFTYQTDLLTPRWVLIDAELPLGATLQIVMQRTAPASPPASEVIVLVGTQKGHAQAQLLLPAGSYQSTNVVATTFQSPAAPGDPTSFSRQAHIHVDFVPAGSAKGAAVGNGTSYASLNPAVDCAGLKLKGKFLKAAGTKAKPTLKKAIFKVNGVTSKVIKKIRKGTRITLKNLPADKDLTVQAVFKKVGGGKASFTRDYRSCS